MLRKALYLVGFCLLISVWGPAAHAQTVNAATCNVSDVQRALNSVNQATATVLLPSGTCLWTTNLSYTVPSGVTSLTVQGNTTVNCTGTAGTSSYACTATDNTVIQDGVTSNNNAILAVTIPAGTFLRWTGTTFEGGNGNSASKYSGTILFQGASQNFRFDHNHINAENYPSSNVVNYVRLLGALEGVADHDLWDLTPTNAGVWNGIQVLNDIGDRIGYADGAWANTSGWGSGAAFFVENSVFNGGASNDCDDGGQLVMRYNTFNDEYIGVQTHGTKQDEAAWRGCRSIEIYHNYFTGPSGSPAYQAISMKGGTGLIWANTVAAGYYVFEYSTDRNGVTHDEVATPSGWGYCGTAENGTGSSWDGNSSATTGYPCLDGVGRGQTPQALNGQYWPSRLDASTRSISWPQQYLEPIYAFDNTVYSGFREFATGDHSTAQNRDVYVDSSTFNGTTGTGSGTLASRPSTCTPGPGGAFGQSPTGSYGVGYFATDTNTLYVCTSANAWTAIYSPYAYPHPLISGGGSQSSGNAPTAPTGLTATIQ